MYAIRSYYGFLSMRKEYDSSLLHHIFCNGVGIGFQVDNHGVQRPANITVLFAPWFAVKKAEINRTYTGNRALHDINGMISIVSSRSFLLSSVRVAIRNNFV